MCLRKGLDIQAFRAEYELQKTHYVKAEYGGTHLFVVPDIER